MIEIYEEYTVTASSEIGGKHVSRTDSFTQMAKGNLTPKQLTQFANGVLYHFLSDINISTQASIKNDGLNAYMEVLIKDKTTVESSLEVSCDIEVVCRDKLLTTIGMKIQKTVRSKPSSKSTGVTSYNEYSYKDKVGKKYGVESNNESKIIKRTRLPLAVVHQIAIATTLAAGFVLCLVIYKTYLV